MSLLEVKNLTKEFPIMGGVFRKQVGAVKAVTDISFVLKKGETLGVVGESGCGKTTLGRTLLRLYEPTSGQILFEGEDFTKMSPKELKANRKYFQMIFQDPYASLNPRMSVRAIVEEPIKLHNLGTAEERLKKILSLMDLVGLRREAINRYPHEFSGGQRQRIGIARALALNPKLIICDEPVSALDVSIQSQVLNLLVDLQKKLGLSYIFITHDLSVVRYISNRIAVMYLGNMVETGSTDEVFANPSHPYTKALLESIPSVDPHKRGHGHVLEGDVPSPSNPPPGCAFNTRCKFVKDICFQKAPVLEGPLDGHRVACHFNDLKKEKMN